MYTGGVELELERYVPSGGWSPHTLGLAKMRALMANLGNPQDRLRVVHVGGTSGKGSTASLTASILSAHGLRVGLHVSPFVHHVEEAWQIDGKCLPSGTVLAELAGPVREAADAVAAEFGDSPSYFEVKVATAFVLFADLGVDCAVIEVGLGGKLDATNVLRESVAVLTNVGLDHVEILGDTIAQIAAEKVQIVKSNSVVISGFKQSEAVDALTAQVAATGSRLLLIGGGVDVVDEEWVGVDVDGVRVPVDAAVLGEDVQRDNVVLAIAAAAQLVELCPDLIGPAVRRVRLPGRLEVVERSNRIVIDGAHNTDKIGSTVRWLGRHLVGWRLVGLVGFKAGKDIDNCLQLLLPLLSDLVITTFESGLWRCAEPDSIAQRAAELGFAGTVVVEPDVRDAIRAADRLAAGGSEPTSIVVTGSLYLAGAVRAVLDEDSPLPTGSY